MARASEFQVSCSPRQWSSHTTAWGLEECIPLSAFEKGSTLLHEDGSLELVVTIEYEDAKVDVSEVTPDNPYEPCLVSMLDDPACSFNDVSLYGCDSCAPVQAHRAILGFRVEYFAKAFAFKTATRDTADGGNEGNISFADISKEALRLIVRRVYGERLPDFSAKEVDEALLLEIWLFAAVRCMDTLRMECEEIVKSIASPATMTVCFRMALLLDNEMMLTFLATKQHTWKKPGKNIVETLTYDEMRALTLHSPASLKALRWAGLWLDYEENRSSHGEGLFEAIDVDRIPASDLNKMAELDVVRKYAPRECLLYLLSK